MSLSSCTCGSYDSSSPQADSDSIAEPVTVVTATDVAVPADTLPALSVQQIDSLRFRLTHHYSLNFNFLVKADSLQLVPRLGDTTTDTCLVHDGDLIVVAQIHTQLAQDSLGADTVWVKVARDQQTMGWVEEGELLRSVVPDDPISQILDALTYSRGVWMTLLVVLGLAALWFSRRRREFLPSPYPYLLLALVGIVATLYASVQNFAPEFWLEYYFHPTMNPLMLPHVMSLLVTLVWLLLIVVVAVVFEVYSRFYFVRGVVYLLQLAGLSMAVYLIISWTTLIYVGYVLLPLLLYVLWRHYRRRAHCRMACGHCGAPLREKGTCPYCGCVNE